MPTKAADSGWKYLQGWAELPTEYLMLEKVPVPLEAEAPTTSWPLVPILQPKCLPHFCARNTLKHLRLCIHTFVVGSEISSGVEKSCSCVVVGGQSLSKNNKVKQLFF